MIRTGAWLAVAVLAWGGPHVAAAEDEAAAIVAVSAAGEPAAGMVTVTAGADGDAGGIAIDVEAIGKAVQAALAGVTGAAGVAGGAFDADMAAAISKAVQSAVSGQVGSAAIKVLAVPGGATGGAKGTHTWLGLGTTEVGDEVRAQLPLADGIGVLVSYVADDSPASKAGIQVNDILTKLDDQVLVNSAQFRQLVRARGEGDAVALRGLRKGKEKAFRATLGRKEGDEDAAGIHVISFGNDAARLKLEIPAEIKRLLESYGGSAATVFSTNIVISGHTSLVIRTPANQAAP